jgi:hypothetical protein
MLGWRDVHEHGSKCVEKEFLPRNCIDLAKGTFDCFILVGVESLVQGDRG